MRKLQFRFPAVLIVISFLLPLPAAQANPTAAASHSAENEMTSLSQPNDSEIVDELVPSRVFDNPVGQPEEPVKRAFIPATPEQLALTKAKVADFDCSTVSDVPPLECEALVALYNSTNGAGWGTAINWLETTTVGNWYGVTVTLGRVSYIDLLANNLTGNIPSALGNLTDLIYLGMNNNQITGVIPSFLGNLTNLWGLNLSDNFLSGPIPPELGSMTNLQNLLLYRNQLIGSIPSQLADLLNLRYLELWNNNLTGSIPSSLGGIPWLSRIILSNNQLSGSIPPELSIPPLEILDLSSNQLVGILPPELGSLIYLEHLYLQGNLLAGSIPLTFINLVDLGIFYFYDTSLCEPTTPEFLTWKQSVGDWQGSNIICDAINVDIDFRSVPDGYGFVNWPSFNPMDYTISDQVRMFGIAAVCWQVVGSFCVPNPKAELFNFWENLIVGHCLGMSVTSLRFFKGIDLPLNLNGVYFLDKDSSVIVNWLSENFSTSARRNITYFHIMQGTEPIAQNISDSLQKTPSDMLYLLAASMSGPGQDYPILFFHKNNMKGGHAVTPYAIESQGEGVFWIRIYDNNYPGYHDRKIVVDTNLNTWSYYGDYYGDATSNNIGFLPISLFAQRPQCPWCENTLNSISLLQLNYDGSGEFLITDSLGNRLGFQAGVFYDEIPGAFANPQLGGLEVDSQPIFYLPVSDEYDVTIDGAATEAPESGSLVSFGPGYAVQIAGITTGPSTFDEISISSNGTAFTYQPNQSQQVDVGLYLDTDTASWQLQTGQVDIAAGQTGLITVDSAQKTLTVNNLQNASGDYNLLFKRVSDDGTEFFAANAIALPAAVTHSIHFEGWQDSGTAQLDTDTDGDGVPEEIIYLDNQMKYLFLPITFR